MNYEYRIQQGVKRVTENDYTVIDEIANTNNMDAANELFNYYKKIGENSYAPRYFTQITQLVKVYINKDGEYDQEKEPEIIREEEWKFYGRKGRRI